MWKAETVFQDIRATVHGYDVPLIVIETGGAAPTNPVNGAIAATTRPEPDSIGAKQPIPLGHVGPLLPDVSFSDGSAGHSLRGTC